MSLHRIKIIDNDCQLPDFPSRINRLSLKDAFAIKTDTGLGSRCIITFTDDDRKEHVVSINSETVSMLSCILKGLE